MKARHLRHLLWPALILWWPFKFLWNGIEAFFYCGFNAVCDDTQAFKLWATDVPNRAITSTESVLKRWGLSIVLVVIGILIGVAAGFIAMGGLDRLSR